MNRKFCLVFVLALFSSLLVFGTLSAAENAPAAASKATHVLLNGGEDSPMSTGKSFSGFSSPASLPDPPGDTVGFTEYEYQKNGSMGRQIAYTPSLDGSPYVHFLWMKLPGAGNLRRINYNARNLATGAWAHSSGASGGKEVSGGMGGYTTIDVTSLGAAVGAWHEGPSSILYRTKSGIDSSPPTGVFSLEFAPYPPNCQGIISGEQEGDAFIWPVLDFQTMSNGDQVIHLVSTESPPTPAEGETGDPIQSVIYYRYVNGAFDKCPGGDSLGLFIDSSQTVAGIVRSDPNPTRDNVAIIYLQQIDFGPANPCSTFGWAQADIVYLESVNGGADWGAPVNITDYSQGGTIPADEIQFMANNEVTAIYDSYGVLHIVWTTPDHDLEDGPCQPLYRCSMWHWSNDQAPGVNISQVLDATAVTGFCSGGIGSNMGAISKCNISECYSDEGARLYVSFTQFGVQYQGSAETQFNEADCSNNGHANGDIMITASTDGGVTWGPDGSLPAWDTTSTTGTGTPVKRGTTVNLTNTFTRDCLAGDCHNENFGSMAKYSTDEVHIMYIDDLDAGSGILATPEGEITLNPVKYMTYDCFTPEAIFDYATGAQSYDLVVSPSDSTGCRIDATTTFELRLTNNGNVPINFTLVPSEGWIVPATPSGTITAGIDATQYITVTIGPVAAEGNYYGTIAASLTSDAGNDNFEINIRLRARCQYYEDEYSDPLLSTVCWSVAVWNVGRAGLAATSELGNMYWFEDSVQLMYDEGVVVTYADDPSQTYFSFFDGSDSGVYFEGASELTLENHDDYDYAIGEFITPDKVVYGIAEYYVPIHPDTCVLIERVTFTNNTDTIIRIHIGEGIDWDIPDGEEGSDNRSGADEIGQYIYQYGPIADPQQDYYAGAAFSHEIAGAIVLENDIWVYPNSGYVPADIGNLLATHTGFVASHPDSIEDLNSFYAVCQDLEIEPGKSIIICKVKTSSLTGETDFDDMILKGRAWITSQKLLCPGCSGIICLEGDANGSASVDIDDVVYLIAYIFTGGPEPVAAICCGDANGSYSVDIDDVVYLIAYIFTGGPAPIYTC